MSDDTPTSLQPAPIQQSPQDRASESAIESYITNEPPAQTEAAFNRSSVAFRRSSPEEGATPDPNQWRDGNDVQPLAPMPDAPHVPDAEVTAAINKLNSRGDSKAALVQEWGADFAQNFSFAREAYREAVTAHPDLVAKFDANGLGDHAGVLAFLSKQGRLTAGLMGTLPRNNNPTSMPMPTFIPSASPSPARAGPSGRSNQNGNLETRGELNRLLEANPPGSPGYKSYEVSQRISQLYAILTPGSGNVVGQGGRRV